MSIEIRPIAAADRGAFFDLLRYCFRTWTAQPPAEEELAGILPEQTLGLFVDEKLASALRIHSFRQSVRGVLKRMGGLAAVASYPEYRGMGNVDRLLAAAYQWMREHDRPVSMLHPFRESFYQRHGYVATAAAVEIEVPTHAFAHYLARPLDPGLAIERLRPLEARAAYESFLEEMAHHTNGFVLHDDLADERWQSQYRDWVYLLVRRGRAVVAAARYEKRGEKLNQGTLRFREIFWRDLSGRDALFRFIALHRDNAASIVLELPHGAPVHTWLYDAMSPFRLSMDEKPWMVRIVDLPGSMTGLPVATEGRIILEVADERCPWNDGRFTLEGRGGRLTVLQGGEGPAVNIDIRGLAALLYGSLGMAELARRGWASGEADLLDQWFPVRPFFCSLRF